MTENSGSEGHSRFASDCPWHDFSLDTNTQLSPGSGPTALSPTDSCQYSPTGRTSLGGRFPYEPRPQIPFPLHLGHLAYGPIEQQQAVYPGRLCPKCEFQARGAACAPGYSITLCNQCSRNLSYLLKDLPRDRFGHQRAVALVSGILGIVGGAYAAARIVSGLWAFPR